MQTNRCAFDQASHAGADAETETQAGKWLLRLVPVGLTGLSGAPRLTGFGLVRSDLQAEAAGEQSGMGNGSEQAQEIILLL
jgi:hypothetical protein